jgi:hypothetical protein
MEVYKFDDALIKRLKDQGVRFIDLHNAQGEKLVPRNQNFKQLTAKISEVKTRLKSLPDGVYTLGAYYNANPQIKGDKFYIGKGNYKNAVLAEAASEVIQPPAKRATRTEESVNVLSYGEALKNIQEIAQLKATVERLESENAALRTENLELREELAEIDDGGNSDSITSLAEGFKSIFSPIAPLLPTLADEYFKLQHRKLTLEEAKQFAAFKKQGLVNGNGYTGGRIQKAAQRIPAQPAAPATLPDVNNEAELNKFCDWLDTLNDEQFNAQMDAVQQADATLFEVLQAIYFPADEDNDDENEQ